MNHVDLVVAAVGMLIAVSSVVLGAWLDLRPEDRRSDEPAGRRETLHRPAEATLGERRRRAPRRHGNAR
jgi:hypothetical protein